jgi:hypothetical protein
LDQLWADNIEQKKINSQQQNINSQLQNMNSEQQNVNNSLSQRIDRLENSKRRDLWTAVLADAADVVTKHFLHDAPTQTLTELQNNATLTNRFTVLLLDLNNKNLMIPGQWLDMARRSKHDRLKFAHPSFGAAFRGVRISDFYLVIETLIAEKNSIESSELENYNRFLVTCRLLVENDVIFD